MQSNVFTQAAIRFFKTKYQILQLYPNGHLFFYSEIRNLELFPKWPFVFFYNETQNFEICTQTAVCFSERGREF